MKKCQKCGKAIPDNETKCQECKVETQSIIKKGTAVGVPVLLGGLVKFGPKLIKAILKK